MPIIEIAMFSRIKNRASFVVMAVMVILAGLVWVVSKNQRETIKSSGGTVPMGWVGTPPAAKIQIVVVPAAAQPIAPVVSVVQTPPIVEVVHVDAEGASKHVAVSGETVTSMAANLLGKDTKTNRDAIINANASLKADPDKVVVGKAYRIPSAGEVPADSATSASPVAQAIIPPASPTVQPKSDELTHADPAPQLKYMATSGDTVTKMAGAFLGNDDKAHQDTIVNANSSLKGDPDHVVAGQAYKIPVPNGLSASATPSAAATLPRPTTQPDADQLVVAGQPRALRYTARSGDTVTTLAIALLGSDTLEKRTAIINNNPSLKSDPDLVVAGQSYWIPAPKADGANP
jgi:nucleoid-associated protein YgaU